MAGCPKCGFFANFSGMSYQGFKRYENYWCGSCRHEWSVLLEPPTQEENDAFSERLKFIDIRWKRDMPKLVGILKWLVRDRATCKECVHWWPCGGLRLARDGDKIWTLGWCRWHGVGGYLALKEDQKCLYPDMFIALKEKEE